MARNLNLQRLQARPAQRHDQSPRHEREHTLLALADHGVVGRTVDADAGAAERTLNAASAAGIDLATLTAQLERDGVRSFCDSYHRLLDCIERKLAATSAR
jgi:hypothetical protein